MSRVTKTTRGWGSPGRYIQGPGEIENIAIYTRKFGKRVYAVIDEFFYESLASKFKEIYSQSDSELCTAEYKTEITEERISRTTEDAKEFSADVVIGVGGGKCIDLAKAVSRKLGISLVVVPTIASTDAPTSSVSVFYHENGVHSGEYLWDFNPEMVLVDSKIIANAPVRFLVSGMGDALSTFFEARAHWQADTPNIIYKTNGGFRSTIAARAIAQACYDTLIKKGLLAKQAAEVGCVSEALEDIIEANTLLSGLGFENNGVAGAHAVSDGITALPAARKSMHGERVAFGTLCQLIIENAEAEQINEVLEFCVSVGLPVCLEDLQIENTPQNIQIIAENSMHSNFHLMPFNVTVDMVYACICIADSVGRSRRGI